MNGIIRVFPTQTNCAPTDDMAFFDLPGLFIPEHREVHICCVFTWDKPWAEYLKDAWEAVSPKVKLGGPAYDDPGGNFIPGMYTKKGLTITSRGCPNNCMFCFVPKREGKLREIEIKAGNIINDNNFLACRRQHRRKVYDMLRTQAKIEFKGGLESHRLTDWDIEEMRSLRIWKLWLACDHPGNVPMVTRKISKLIQAGFTRDQIHCYVLIGDNMAENESRLETIYNAGALPFAQLYQPEQRIAYSKEWKEIARIWSRPAIYKGFMRAKADQSQSKAVLVEEVAKP
jgi:hypothetical protein